MSDLFDLSPTDFDSAKNGWRMYDTKGDYNAALKILKEYVEKRKNDIEASNDITLQTFNFHIGQMYACRGRQHYKDALLYFEKSRKNRPAWDMYVDATISFLKSDSASLDNIYQLLSGIMSEADQLLNVVSELKRGLANDLEYVQAYEGTPL